MHGGCLTVMVLDGGASGIPLVTRSTIGDPLSASMDVVNGLVLRFFVSFLSLTRVLIFFDLDFTLNVFNKCVVESLDVVVTLGAFLSVSLVTGSIYPQIPSGSKSEKPNGYTVFFALNAIWLSLYVFTRTTVIAFGDSLPPCHAYSQQAFYFLFHQLLFGSNYTTQVSGFWI